MCIIMCACEPMYTYICVNTCICDVYVYMSVYICDCTHVCLYIFVYVYVCIYAYVCICVCVYVCVYVCIDIYTHTKILLNLLYSISWLFILLCLTIIQFVDAERTASRNIYFEVTQEDFLSFSQNTFIYFYICILIHSFLPSFTGGRDFWKNTDWEEMSNSMVFF